MSTGQSNGKSFAVGWRYGAERGEDKVQAQNMQLAAKLVQEQVAKRMGSTVQFVTITSVSVLS